MVSKHRSTLGRSASLCFWILLLIILPSHTKAQNADGDSAANTYKISIGDRIKVIILKQPDLSGDFLVDAAGSIHYPIIGSIRVAGLTIDQIQSLLNELLAEGILKHPMPFVSISEFRPVSIIGDVRRPGSYPFYIGSIVMGVIAQAGGYGVQGVRRSDAISEFLSADERVRSLNAKRERLLLTYARITAELDGKETFEAPSLSTTTEPDDFNQVIKDEIRIFRSETALFEKEVDLIKAQRPQLEAEVTTMNQLIASEVAQIGLIQKRIDEYAKLAAKGLTRSSSMLELKLSLGVKESNVFRLEAEKLRLSSKMMELDRRLQDYLSNRKRGLLSKLEKTRAALHEVNLILPIASEVREIKRKLVARVGNAVASRSIRITRLEQGEVVSVDASLDYRVRPGDVIEVIGFTPSGVVGKSAQVKGMEGLPQSNDDQTGY